MKKIFLKNFTILFSGRNLAGCLTIFLLFFICGCIDGQAVLTLNSDCSGKVKMEGIFDYPAAAVVRELDFSRGQLFFFKQMQRLLADENFESISDVKYKFLADGRIYFSAVGYFKDINRTDFNLGAFATGLAVQQYDKSKDTQNFELILDNSKISIVFADADVRLSSVLNMKLVLVLPFKVSEYNGFEKLDDNMLLYALSGSDWIQQLYKSWPKALAVKKNAENFDYAKEIKASRRAAGKLKNRIAQDIVKAQKSYQQKMQAGNVYVGKLRKALACQEENDYQKAIEIFSDIAGDKFASGRYVSEALYHRGRCFMYLGDEAAAIGQFEAVIDGWPSERAALKAVKQLQAINKGIAYRRAMAAEQNIYILDSSPKLYDQSVDANTDKITFTFSEPMEKFCYAYSQSVEGILPQPAGEPYYDSSFTKWILPVSLQAGQDYVIVLNGISTGFRSKSGKLLDTYTYTFSTADANETE